MRTSGWRISPQTVETIRTISPDGLNSLGRYLKCDDFLRTDHGVRWSQGLAEEIQIPGALITSTDLRIRVTLRHFDALTLPSSTLPSLTHPNTSGTDYLGKHSGQKLLIFYGILPKRV